MRILASFVGVGVAIVIGLLLWKFVLLPAIYASGGGLSGGSSPVVYIEKKSGWGAKSKTELSCAGLKRGQPFQCGKKDSPTELCIC